MNCPRCHSMNKVGAQFCLECGFRLVPDPVGSAQTGIPSLEPNRTRQGRSSGSGCFPVLLLGAGVVIILCALISIGLYLVKGDEVKVALSKLRKSDGTPIVLEIPTDVPVSPPQQLSTGTSPVIASTSQAPTPGSTITQLPTAVIFPTDTPIPQSEIYSDDFSSNQGWESGSIDRYSLGTAEGGIYRMEFWIAGDTEWVITMQPHSFNNPLQDVYVSVMGIGMNDFGAYGLVCRCTDRDNLYGFHIANDGRYWIFKMVDGIGTTLASKSISGFQGDIHEIEMSCIDETIMVGVDGNTLEEIRDGSLSEGNAGLFAQPLGGSLEGPWSFYVSFDDFYMEVLP